VRVRESTRKRTRETEAKKENAEERDGERNRSARERNRRRETSRVIGRKTARQQWVIDEMKSSWASCDAIIFSKSSHCLLPTKSVVARAGSIDLWDSMLIFVTCQATRT